MKQNDDTILSEFLNYFWIILTIYTIMDPLIGLTGQNALLLQALFAVMLLPSYLKALFAIKRNKIILFLNAEIFMGLLFLGSIMRYNHFDIAKYMLLNMFVCVPLFFCFLCMTDLKTYEKLFDKFSLYVFYISLSIIVVKIVHPSFTYSSLYAYNLLWALLWHSRKIIENDKRKMFIPIVVIELLLLYFFGTRSALICFAVYFIMASFPSHKKLFVVSLLLFVALGVAIFAAYSSSSSTSSLRFFFLNLSESRGLIELWKESIPLIGKNVIWGLGLAGEAQYLQGGISKNFIIEILIDYGAIFGLTVLALFGYGVVKLLKENKRFPLLLVSLCAGWLPLFSYSTYLYNPYFYFMIGIFVFIIINDKGMSDLLGNKATSVNVNKKVPLDDSQWRF